MKKLFILTFAAVLITAFTQVSVAQDTKVKLSSRTLTNASTASYDTILFRAMPSNVFSIQATLTRLTGSISTSGTALLQYSNDGTGWNDANTDTLKFTNQLYNTKVWPLTATYTAHYRVIVQIPSSTSTSSLTASYCRRPDEIKH